MNLINYIATKREEYTIADRDYIGKNYLPNELSCIASEVVDEARVYFDSPENNGGPRSWPSYEAFLGFQIAKVQLTYQMKKDELQEVVALVYKQEADEIAREKNNREIKQMLSEPLLPD